MDRDMGFGPGRPLDAVLEETVERGHREADVEATMRRLGLDAGGEGKQFRDPEHCLFAAYDQLTERLWRGVVERCPSDAGWPERVNRGLVALLEQLAAEPWAARVLTVTFPAINPRARRRHQAFIESFVPLMREGREYSEAEELPAELELMAIGAAEALIFDEVQSGRATALPALGAELLFALLVPFLGPEAATAEMARARATDEGELKVV